MDTYSTLWKLSICILALKLILKMCMHQYDLKTTSQCSEHSHVTRTLFIFDIKSAYLLA